MHTPHRLVSSTWAVLRPNPPKGGLHLSHCLTGSAKGATGSDVRLKWLLLPSLAPPLLSAPAGACKGNVFSGEEPVYWVCLCCPETVDIQDILLPSLGNEKLIAFVCQQELCSPSPWPPGWGTLASHCTGIYFLSGSWGAVRRGRSSSLGWGPGLKRASCRGCGPFLLRCCSVQPNAVARQPLAQLLSAASHCSPSLEHCPVSQAPESSMSPLLAEHPAYAHTLHFSCVLGWLFLHKGDS